MVDIRGYMNKNSSMKPPREWAIQDSGMVRCGTLSSTSMHGWFKRNTPKIQKETWNNNNVPDNGHINNKTETNQPKKVRITQISIGNYNNITETTKNDQLSLKEVILDKNTRVEKYYNIGDSHYKYIIFNSNWFMCQSKIKNKMILLGYVQ